ncbi:MAG: protein kinase, partial [Chlamydiia bacterium]|nr:protein kinase [Chlamydiia bacterium]
KKTLLGKVVGPLSYMAPERAKGERATPQTDIYALGVILYQLLTLHLPFQRRSLKEFHEKMAEEMAEHPTEVAPYRDVPHVLAQIALRCIEKDSQLRYDSVEELVHDLESYLEGRSEWFPIATLDIDHKEDWEFQENILFAEHTAITRQPEISDWFYLMISRQAFSENIKVEAEVHFDEEGEGIGFLIGVPESAEREHLLDGYCLWIASDGQKRSQLFRNSVEAMVLDDVYIPKQTWTKVAIEKVENHIHVFFNDTHQFSYLSHLPIVGTHVGLIHKDTNFQIRNITVSVGSHSITVNCLAIPDAFLAQKDYQTALAEYRRIGYSFPGRQEGREALFRAGIALLEQAIHEEAPEKKQELYNQALEEFETLHQTPGAPLEYLGKGLVYQAQKEYSEEIKCFELAVRRYPHHPLMPILHEHILCRTQETSRLDRRAAYEYLLLVLRKLPPSVRGTQLEKMLINLQKNWEPIHFLHPMPELGEKESWDLFCIPLAFWLQKTYVFQEMVDEILAVTPKSTDTLFDAILCLILTKKEELALEAIDKTYEALQTTDSQAIIDNLAFLKALASHNFQDCHTYFSNFDRHMSFVEETCLFFFLLWLLDRDRSNQVIELVGKINNRVPSPRYIRFRDTFLVWAHLLNKEWKEAGDILHSHPEEVLADESSPLYFLHGCWLSFVESKDLGHVHLSGVQEATYPRTWTLAAHYLNGKLNETWEEKAFPWEKRFLYHQLHLYYTLQDNKTLAREFKNKFTKWPD